MISSNHVITLESIVNILMGYVTPWKTVAYSVTSHVLVDRSLLNTIQTFLFREGAIYGLGLAMSSLSVDTEISVNDRAKLSYSKMVEYFHDVKRDRNCKKLQVLNILSYFPCYKDYDVTYTI